MDIGKSFTYVFDDEEWVSKVLVGGLFIFLSGVFIGVPFIMGYYLETLKNVYLGQPRPLPSWADNFGGFFSKGLKALGGVLVWLLPIFALLCVFVIGIIGLGGNTPRGQEGIITVVSVCFFCLIVAYSLVMSALLPSALTKFAVTGEMSAFLRPGETIAFVRGNLGNYIIAIIVSWLGSLIGEFGVILCFVGVFFTTFWSMLVGAHLLGQVYRAARGQPA